MNIWNLFFAIISLNSVSATACDGRQDFKVSGEFSSIFSDVLWTMQTTCVLGELDVPTCLPSAASDSFELLPAWLHPIRNRHWNRLILKIKSTNFLLTKTAASTMLEALAVWELWLMLHSREVCLLSSNENQGVRGYSGSCTPSNFSAMPSGMFAALLLVFGRCHLWC